jgi:Na+-translocating ferredoxin:NAD+ oxidoreductase RnfE subunit
MFIHDKVGSSHVIHYNSLFLMSSESSQYMSHVTINLATLIAASVLMLHSLCCTFNSMLYYCLSLSIFLRLIVSQCIINDD